MREKFAALALTFEDELRDIVTVGRAICKAAYLESVVLGFTIGAASRSMGVSANIGFARLGDPLAQNVAGLGRALTADMYPAAMTQDCMTGL